MSAIPIGLDGSGTELITDLRDVVAIPQNAPDELVQRVRDRMQTVAERESWMRYRLPVIAENLKRNTALLDERPDLVTPIRWLWGKTAVIVSAGVSIDDQIGDITEASNSGAVYVTNSASNLILGDVIVYAESLPSVIAPMNDEVPLACDLSSHHSVFAREDLDHVFIKAEATYSGIAERYRARTISYGTSVSTAAVAMAAAHGARRIVLVGQDLSFSASSGKVYNAGSPLASMRIEIDEDTGIGTYVNVPDGVRRPPVEMQRLGETDMWTTADFIAVAEWLEGFAARHPEIECVNATSTGMLLEGWAPMPLTQAMSDAPRLPYGAEPFPSLEGLGLVERLRLCRRWEQMRPEVRMLTTISKLDKKDRELAEDAIKDAIDMYRKAAEEIGGQEVW